MNSIKRIFAASPLIRLPLHGVIVIILVMELIPVYMMLQMSVKDNQSFLVDPWLPPPVNSWNLGNYVAGVKLIVPYLINTFFVACLTVGLTLFFAILGAYFFARKRVPLQGVLWYVFLFLMLMPSIANIVPLFSLLRSLGLINTLWALIVAGVAGGQVFNMFILRGFIEELPAALFEAAEIDGASHLQQILHVVVPMCAPILGTLAILSFIGTWNDYLLPFIVLRDPEKFTLGIGLIFLDGEYVKRWGEFMAAYVVASLPLVVIFLFSMRFFVEGLSSGAVKG